MIFAICFGVYLLGMVVVAYVLGRITRRDSLDENSPFIVGWPVMIPLMLLAFLLCEASRLGAKRTRQK